MTTYDQSFYANRDRNKDAARIIIPIVQEYVNAASVVDVGCAIGVWLSVFAELGVHDLLGLDGDWVPRNMLEIPAAQFVSFDLNDPIRLPRRFDLAVSLEVVEHLPATSAPTIVESLTRLSPCILFSAAIPFQGGVGHVNEQWPDYWIRLFLERHYVPIDCIRPRIWSDPRVIDHSYHYAQNVLLFVNEQRLADNAKLRAAYERTDLTRLSMVHPKFFLDHADPVHTVLDASKVDEYRALSLMMVVPLIPPLLKRAVLHRLGKTRENSTP